MIENRYLTGPDDLLLHDWPLVDQLFKGSEFAWTTMKRAILEFSGVSHLRNALHSFGAADVAAVLQVQKGKTPRGLVNRDVLGRSGFKDKQQKYSKRN